MRESGFIGLLQVIFDCVRDGFGLRRAWTVMAVIALMIAAMLVRGQRASTIVMSLLVARYLVVYLL